MNEETMITVAELQTGDNEAFDRIYMLYFNALYRFAYRLILSPDAEDLVQEVFVNLYEKRLTLPGDTPLKPYLYAATRNRCMNYLRHLDIRDKNKEKLVESIVFSADHDTGEEITERVNACISKLSAQQQLILRLHAEGMSYRQIAEKLNISTGTVNTHVSRAYLHFKKFFAFVFSFF
ncbi:MAG: RNA polymerase sigma-70 factor [Odoribacteraceae bacterium]|jgi:RNA polymerase sigma-70 factor (ECF subfamily)|nr:RNA polymerase sigma-70 factor [Odoribacteraceae bacterium]